MHSRIMPTPLWLVALALIATSCTTTSSPQSTTGGTVAESLDGSTTTTVATTVAGPGVPRIGVIFGGVVANQGWDWAHDRALRDALEATGEQAVVTAVEAVTTAAAARQTARSLAAEADIVFVPSPALSDAVVSVADEFPETFFLVAGGVATAANVGTYGGAEEEAWYLAGMAASASTSSDVIGFIAPDRDPAVVRSINAFTLGARERAPETTVRVVWTNRLFDPPTEGAATELLIDLGAGVIASYQDSVAAGIVADAAGVPWIGWSTHASALPDSLLTGIVWDWTDLYRSLLDGFFGEEWTPPDQWAPGSTSRISLASGGISLLPLADLVTPEDQEVIALRREQLQGGTAVLFTDPIIGADGVSRALGDLSTMDFFVAGVEAP